MLRWILLVIVMLAMEASQGNVVGNCWGAVCLGKTRDQNTSTGIISVTKVLITRKMRFRKIPLKCL